MNQGNFSILPYGLRTVLCVRTHHNTEPTWVGLGPIEPLDSYWPRTGSQGAAEPGTRGAHWPQKIIQSPEILYKDVKY